MKKIMKSNNRGDENASIYTFSAAPQAERKGRLRPDLLIVWLEEARKICERSAVARE